jgi:hypothetical protein
MQKHSTTRLGYLSTGHAFQKYSAYTISDIGQKAE